MTRSKRGCERVVCSRLVFNNWLVEQVAGGDVHGNCDSCIAARNSDTVVINRGKDDLPCVGAGQLPSGIDRDCDATSCSVICTG